MIHLGRKALSGHGSSWRAHGLCQGAEMAQHSGARENQERKFPHARADSNCGLWWRILPLFPGTMGVRTPDLRIWLQVQSLWSIRQIT